MERGRPNNEYKPKTPLESAEQKALVQVLDLAELCFTAVPNGGFRNKREAADLIRQGVKPGFPDIAVFTRPPLRPEKVGTAIEMKRVNGEKPRPNQLEWHEKLRQLDWEVIIAYGCLQAGKQLIELGYPINMNKLLMLCP